MLYLLMFLLGVMVGMVIIPLILLITPVKPPHRRAR